MVTIGIFDQSAGKWEPYATFATYDEADTSYDAVCDLYPNSWVEILDGALSIP